MVVPVYTQENRSDTYIGAKDLPALSQFTIGMWFYGQLGRMSSDFLKRRVIISIFGKGPITYTRIYMI